MTTQYTPTLKLALPVTGELSGTWGDVVNDNITSMIEQAIAGLSTINTWTANAHTLTTANGTTSESRCAMLVAATGGGAPSAAAEIICPAAAKLYVLQNNTSYAVTLKTSAGTGVAVAAGNTAFLFCDGTNVNSCVTTIVDGNITGNLTVGGNATINGNTTLGNATSDTITATARFNTDLVPSTDNARDLGSVANSWKDLYIDGTAYLALVDINGGTIDGVSIGATTAATLINVDNLRLDGNTLSSTDTNGNVVIAPNGTGDVQLDADTVRVGDAAAAATLTSNGAGALTVTTGGAADLTLSTNGGTTSGTVVIANGANGNITLTPDGTGDVILSADRVQMGDSNTDTTLTTNGTGSLNLTTNNGSNSGTLQIAQGINGNITLTPNGTGSVSISKLYSSGDTILGATSANTLSVAATITSNLLFTDATYDIGATGANRPRDLFLSRNLTVGGTLTLTGGVNLNGNVTVGDASTDTLTINSTITSNLIFTDNTYDIGASGATRPRNLYLAGTATIGGNTAVTGTLSATSTVSAGNGENVFGTGGTGATSSSITLNGGSTSGWGSFITFKRNSVSKGYVGLESQLIGNNSDDTIVYAASGQNIKHVVNAATITTTSSTGLAVAPGVLTLGTSLVYDAFINTPENMYFNVDSDGNSTGNFFVWGTDRSGTTGGTEFMRIAGATGGVGAVGIGYSSLTSVGDNGLAVLGNVGIGTSSPGYKLHVSNYMALGTQASAGAGAGINLIPSSTLTNWFVGANYVNSGTFQIIPSTAGGGSTFTTPALTIDSSGRLGLGITPNTTWGTGWAAQQITGLSLAASGVGTYQAFVMAGNAVMTGTTADSVAANYVYGDFATMYRQTTGEHQWWKAGAGTGGNAITFSRAMTLDNGGKLLLGTTTGTGMSNSDFGMVNGGSIRFRNAADSAYINALYFTPSNGLDIGTGGSLSTITFGISGIGEVGRFAATSGAFLVGGITSTYNSAKLSVLGDSEQRGSIKSYQASRAGIASGATTTLWSVPNGYFGAEVSMIIYVSQRDDTGGNLTNATYQITGFGGAGVDVQVLAGASYGGGRAFTVTATSASGGIIITFTNTSAFTNTSITMVANVLVGYGAITWGF